MKRKWLEKYDIVGNIKKQFLQNVYSTVYICISCFYFIKYMNLLIGYQFCNERIFTMKKNDLSFWMLFRGL